MRTVVSIPGILAQARSAFRSWLGEWRHAVAGDETTIRGSAEEVLVVAAHVEEETNEPNGAALTRFIDWVRKAAFVSEDPTTAHGAISFLWTLVAMAHEGSSWVAPPLGVTRLINTGFLQRYLDQETVSRIVAENRRLQERLPEPARVDTEELPQLVVPDVIPVDEREATTTDAEIPLHQFEFYRRWVRLLEYLYRQPDRQVFSSLAITLPERRYFTAGLATTAVVGYLPDQVGKRITSRRRGDRNYFQAAWAATDPWAQLRLYAEPFGEPDPPLTAGIGLMIWLLDGSRWSDFNRMVTRLQANKELSWVVARTVLGYDFAQEHTAAWPRKSVLRNLLPTPDLVKRPEPQPFDPQAVWVPNFILRLLDAAQDPEGWFAGGIARYKRPFFYWYPVTGPPQVSLEGERDYTPAVPNIPFEDIRLQETAFLLRLWDRLYGRNETIERWRRGNWQVVGHAQSFLNRLEIARRMRSPTGEE